MQILLLIAGLILLLAGGSWFAGASTVGIICLGLFGVITAAQVAVVAGVWMADSSIRRRF